MPAILPSRCIRVETTAPRATPSPARRATRGPVAGGASEATSRVASATLSIQGARTAAAGRLTRVGSSARCVRTAPDCTVVGRQATRMPTCEIRSLRDAHTSLPSHDGAGSLSSVRAATRAGGRFRRVVPLPPGATRFTPDAAPRPLLLPPPGAAARILPPLPAGFGRPSIRVGALCSVPCGSPACAGVALRAVGRAGSFRRSRGAGAYTFGRLASASRTRSAGYS
jgi:hypothetical protein